jgi:hypothetical protein
MVTGQNKFDDIASPTEQYPIMEAVPHLPEVIPEAFKTDPRR